MTTKCTPHNEVDASALTDLFINATYFVDSQFGDNATAVNQDSARPYETLDGFVPMPGQVVYVQPGNYSLPVLDLNGAIWYFSAGATVTTLITGTGQIFGNGTFIGQSPIVNHTSTQPLYIQADNFTTASDYAIVINGTGEAQFYIKNIQSQHGIQILAANVEVRLVISGFIGSGTFVNLTDNSTGSLCCQFNGAQCNAAIVSTANEFSVGMTGDCVRCLGPYIADVSDSSGAAINRVKINIGLRRTFCSGVMRISGLPLVSDVLSQPNVNIDIQNIESLNNNANSIILIDRGFCNLTANRFAFETTVAGGYVIDVRDESVLHISAEQIYNNNFAMADIRLINALANSYNSIRCIFNECFVTSQMINMNGAGANVSMNVLNLNTQNPIPGSQVIVNNGGSCLIEFKNAQMFNSPNSIIVTNTGRMHFESAALTYYVENGTFCDNAGQAIFRIGFLQTVAFGGTVFNSRGPLGLALGSIRMDGQNNTAIIARGLTILNVGQILSTTTGNTGILVQDPGELYGRVGRIIMQDQSCLESVTNGRVVISFDEMNSGTNGYVVFIDGKSEVILTGGLIRSRNCKYPIYIAGTNAKFDINLAKLSVDECAAMVYIGAPGCDVNLTIQHLELTTNIGPAAIYAESGNVTIKGGRFTVSSVDIFPVFFVGGDTNMYIDVNFVRSNHLLMQSTTTGNVWYSTSASETTDPENAIELTPRNGNFTISGFFKTRGDHIIRMDGVDSYGVFRVLNGTLVSNGPSMVSNGTVSQFVCNYGVCTFAPLGLTSAPVGVFLADINVQ